MLNATPSWSEEIQIFGHIWLVFRQSRSPIGAARTSPSRRSGDSTPSDAQVFDLMVELLWAGFAITTAYYSYRVRSSPAATYRLASRSR